MNYTQILPRLPEGDADALKSLLEAATAADGHEPIGEHKFLRLQHGDDSARSFVALHDGTLAGYAHAIIYGDDSVRRASCEFVVHPNLRRRGIGAMLLAHVTETTRELGAARLNIWAYNDQGSGERLARSFGLRPVRRLLHMHRHGGASLPLLPDPAFTIRNFEVGQDEQRWIELNRRVFESHPEQAHWTLEDLRSRIAQPWFRPEDFLLAEQDGSIVGFNWLKVEQRRDEGLVGEIYVLGVAAEWQGQGIARQLLAHGFSRMGERGVDVAAVYVDESNESALALYKSTGFHHHHVDVCYSLDLAQGAAITESEAAA